MDEETNCLIVVKGFVFGVVQLRRGILFHELLYILTLQHIPASVFDLSVFILR